MDTLFAPAGGYGLPSGTPAKPYKQVNVKGHAKGCGCSDCVELDAKVNKWLLDWEDLVYARCTIRKCPCKKKKL